MRARLHVRGGRIGFFREGTHDLCDASRTGQLLPATEQVLDAAAGATRRRRCAQSGKSSSARTCPAPSGRCSSSSRRARARATRSACRGSSMPEGVTGLVITRPEAPQFVAGRGHPHVSDVLELARRRPGSVRAAPPSRRRVLPGQPLPAAAARGDGARRAPAAASCSTSTPAPACSASRSRRSGEDTSSPSKAIARAPRISRRTPRRWRRLCVWCRASVENYLSRSPAAGAATILVDPPRTGMSKEAARMIVAAQRPARRLRLVRRGDAGARRAALRRWRVPSRAPRSVRPVPQHRARGIPRRARPVSTRPCRANGRVSGRAAERLNLRPAVPYASPSDSSPCPS